MVCTITDIIMSDWQLLEDINQDNSLGVTLYFPKPMHIEDYEQILSQVIELITY